MRRFVSPLLLVFASSSLQLACAADEGVTDPRSDEVKSTSFVPGRFRMYADQNATPGGSCDRYTSLELSAEEGGKALLREELDGVCDLHVPPDERTYSLQFVREECGSRIYHGTRTMVGAVRVELELTDHRNRACRDLPPATIVAVEHSSGIFPLRNEFYSFDGDEACIAKACGADCTPAGSDEPFQCAASGACVATGQSLGCQ